MHFSLSLSVLLPLAAASAIERPRHHHRDVLQHEERAAAKKVPVYTTCKRPGSVAIAFDDGPYSFTDNVTETLNHHDVKGTFFLNGYNWGCIYAYVHSVKERYREGHMLASHTWSHTDLTTCTRAELNNQFELVELAFKRILGVRPLYFRPPYGSYNDLVLEVAHERGYKGAITWNYDSLDTSTPATPAPKMIEEYKKHFAGGPDGNVKHAITLNHDPKIETAHKVIPAVVPYLKKKGYKLETIPQCLELSGKDDWYVKVGEPETPNKEWTCVGTPKPGQP